MNKTENLSNHVEKLIAKKLTNELVKEVSVVIINANPLNALHGKKIFIKKDFNTNKSIFKYANEYRLFIKDYNEQIEKFNTITVKILFYMIFLFTKQNFSKYTNQIEREIKFQVKDYQKIKGSKNYNKAKNQLIKYVDLLFRSSLKFKITIFNHSKKKKEHATQEINILSSKINIQHGDVIISFTPEFAKLLFETRYLTTLPKIYFSLKSIPAEILFKLTTHDRINKFKKHGKYKKKLKNKNDYQIISVKKLLEAIDSIPSYEKVIKSKNRHVEKRIIDPLIKGLDELLTTWEFCNAKGKPLFKKQLEEINKWNIFKNLYIKYKLTFLNESLNESIETELSPEKSSTLLENNP
jgi:hypothetical protein